MDASAPATATLRVSEVWKGPERETLEVSTSSQEAACGVPFEEGQEYLVYAYGGRVLRPIFAARPSRSPRRVQTSRCSLTARS
jgi:hypothetical protein